MSEGNKPVGDLLAIVPRVDARRGEKDSDFVSLGPAWLTDKGHLMVTMLSEPLAWKDPTCPRRVLVRLRDDVRLVRTGGGAIEARSYAPNPNRGQPSNGRAPDPSLETDYVPVDVEAGSGGGEIPF